MYSVGSTLVLVVLLEASPPNAFICCLLISWKKSNLTNMTSGCVEMHLIANFCGRDCVDIVHYLLYLAVVEVLLVMHYLAIFGHVHVYVDLGIHLCLVCEWYDIFHKLVVMMIDSLYSGTYS